MRTRSLLLALVVLASASAAAAPAAGIGADQFRSRAHPRVYATAEDRDALRQKIERTPWAREIYEKLKRGVDPLVERHVTDPAFIVSRLQMHWAEGERYTDFYTEGNFIPRREGDAPYPTVRVTYGRAAPGSVPTPADLSKLTPYGNGDLPRRNGDAWETVPFEQTQLGAENVNKSLIDSAYHASIVYYFTGDERYAKFAADVLWTFVRGASYQNQVNPGDGYNSHGYLSYETLGDTRRFTNLPLAYDFIRDYFVDEYLESDEFTNGRPGEPWAPGHPQGKAWALGRVEVMFKKFLDNKLTRGGGLEGNWNTNEHQSAMLYALALEDDDAYADGRGRGHYVNRLVHGPTTRGHGAYVDVAKANIHPGTGLWPEPPAGYGQGSIQQLVQFGFVYFVNGIDLLADDPLIRKAAVSFPQMAFPNGYSTGWGDGSYGTIMTDQAELMIAYARRKGDAALEETFTALLGFAGGRRLTSDQALFFYVPELKPVGRAPGAPRTSYSPDHSIVFGRNPAADPVDALAYTVAGFGKASGHAHANGMTLELYGRGHVLGVDPGAGPDYWHPQHANYNLNVAAHNTVAPNGAGADLKRPQDLSVVAAEPEVRAGEPPRAELSPRFQFTDTANVFDARDLVADQRRTVGIVRTGDKTGYYVDVFRSRVRGDGADRYHDYLYHNMGRSLTLARADGAPLELSDRPLDPESGHGYAYFEDDRSADVPGTVVGAFDFGVDGVRTHAWVLGGAGRTLYALTGPNNFRYYLPQLREGRVPTLLLRQSGEAWDRPFVVVYEPSGAGVEPVVRDVRRLAGAPEAGDLVAVAVDRGGGGTDYVLSATDPAREHAHEGVRFAGTYGVVTAAGQGGFDAIYLGTGTRLMLGDHGIASATGEPVKAVLERAGDGGGYTYSADGEVIVRVPGEGGHVRELRLPPASGQPVR